MQRSAQLPAATPRRRGLGGLRALLALSLLIASPAAAEPPPGLRLVVLDPGHGGSNLGAPSRVHHPVRYEKEFTLAVALKVAAELRAAGVTVVLTRERDRDMSLKARIGLANRLRADVFVSIHLNATDIPGPTGHETFFLALEATDEAAKRLVTFENHDPVSVDGDAAAPVADAAADILLDLTRNRAHHDAQRLAGLIQERLTPQSPFKNRGVKQAPFYVLMGAAMPAVVTEIGFINHRAEGRYITSEAGQTALAAGIARGILDYGRLVNAPRAKPETTPTPGGP